MRYSEVLIAPMRQDLTRIGFREARSPEEIDEVLKPGSGTVLMVTNSVCGCAAGKLRPALAMALGQSPSRPDVIATTFAGADLEAVDHLRDLTAQFPPSSPSVTMFQDGKAVFHLHRRDIETREAPLLASVLNDAFARFCAAKA